MNEQFHLDVDVVKDYIEEALAAPTLHPGEREAMLELRLVAEDMTSFAEFDADFQRIDTSTLAMIEQTERHMRLREDRLHDIANKLRSTAGELRAIAAELAAERDGLYAMERELHAMADRVQAEWDVLHAEWRELRAEEEELLPKALKYHVFRELYNALCGCDTRYSQEVASLPFNPALLIAILTRYVARRGFDASAVAAVTATLLWLIAQHGRQTFCAFYAPYFAPAVSQPGTGE